MSPARTTSKRPRGQVVSTQVVQVGPHAVELTRKRIKRVYLRVDDVQGPVRVSAPAHMPLEKIAEFVLGQSPWIENRRKQLAQTPPASPRRGHIAPNGTVMLWGERLPLERVSPKAALLYPAAAGDSQQAKKAERALLASLRAQLAAKAEPLVRAHEARMGVQVAELRYRDMQTRWGTCNPKARRVWLATSLVHFPPECLELIVVHELCHLLEPGHGPRFKSLMSQHLPDWPAREALLKNLAKGR